MVGEHVGAAPHAWIWGPLLKVSFRNLFGFILVRFLKQTAERVVARGEVLVCFMTAEQEVVFSVRSEMKGLRSGELLHRQQSCSLRLQTRL